MPIAVYALSLAAFAIGTAEFIISGILPPLASDLRVSIPAAGLLVSAYAISVAIGGPLLTILSARFQPKATIVAVMLIFGLSQLLCAAAPDYGLLMAARVVSACAHGVFFGAGNIVVARLVPVERRGAALSLFIGGITVANLLGLPGGSAIGYSFGWRASFIAVAVVAGLATLVLLARLPPDRAEDRRDVPLALQFAALRHQQVFLSYLAIAIVMTAALAFGTYQVPLLLTITGVEPALVPLFLLLGGAGAVLGIYVGGRMTDWKAMPALLALLILQSGFYATMLISMHNPWTMAVNLFLTGALGFAFSTPLQARILHASREAPNLASSLISTAFNIGIAAGALLGATLLSSGVSYAQLPMVGIVCGLLAAGVVVLSMSLERQASGASALR